MTNAPSASDKLCLFHALKVMGDITVALNHTGTGVLRINHRKSTRNRLEKQRAKLAHAYAVLSARQAGK